jgi:crossover junction endodeoxyribonuclease RuvC
MILGIDPGLANTGWAVLSDEKTLVECGCLKTKISDSSALRLDHIYCELEGLIKKYKVEAMAIETLFFAKNAKSEQLKFVAKKMELRWQVLLRCR